MKDGAARNAAGALAGSTCLLDECVARLASIGVPQEAAQRMASRRPGAAPRRRLTQIFQNQPRFSKTRSTAHQKTIVTSAKACERSVGSGIQEKPPR